MSARKLGRLAGLVFVLAVVFGAVGAASIDHARKAQVASAAYQVTELTIEWD